MLTILFENKEWIAPLVERLNCQVHFVDISSATVGDIPESVYFNKLSASAFSRGNSSAPALGKYIIDEAEAKGYRVVNGSNSVLLELSKAYQMSRLQAHGIQTPQTLVSNDLAGFNHELKYPVIVKPNCGGKGLGVTLVNSLSELQALDIHSEDGLFLIQQYIKPADGSITRLEFIGGEFYYAVRVDTTGGFERCPADACEIGGSSPFSIYPEFESPMVETISKFLEAEKVDVAGVEFITDDSGETYVYDINTSTNYNTEAEEKVGKSAFDKLSVYLSAISS